MAGLPPLTQLGGNHRSTFEGYWSLLDPSNVGKVDASAAATFLKKSQLREPVLHKIWNMSDPSGKGYLDKQGVFMALRLIAVCQMGKEPSVSNMALSDPPPKLVGVNLPPIAAANKWTVEASDRSKFEQTFQGLQPSKGLLAGDKAKPFMLSSKLPVDALGKIWTLADIDRDGSLDLDEFCVAMKLISLAQGGEVLPASLPASLIPPSKGGSDGTKGNGPIITSTSSNSLSSNMATAGSASPKSSSSQLERSPLSAKKGIASSSGVLEEEWVVSAELKSKYDGYFQGIDKDHDGYISGEEARNLFMASNLKQPVLAHIWNLCDIEKTGRLNAEQFALAMYLIAEKVRQKEVPKELTAAMIPPSLRGKVPPSSSTPSSSSSSSLSSSLTVTSLSNTTSSTSLAWSSSTSASIATLGQVTPSTSTSISTASAWTTPTPLGEDSKEEQDQGFGSDFSAIQELDSITKEIETIRNEKTGLAEEIKAKQELIQQRKGEVEGMQGDIDEASRQREALERERDKARNLLEELNNEKAKLESQIAEVGQNCEDEKEEIERLKMQLSEQETSKRSQAEELEKLQNQLQQLQNEEREYKQKVELGRLELEKLQKAGQNIHSEINQVRQRIDNLKEEHQSLTTALTLYPPTSTPGSTPSSSVININDVGQLSSELHVPHLSEHDAVSVRATIGSSSPVSSLSGFSTNSHLDDGAEEGVAKDDRLHPDPFGSSSGGGSGGSGGDPFAAFSLRSTAGPGGDPFGGQSFSGKPSDLSAFDPFGGNFDPFKSTSSAAQSTGDDLFKGDPFSAAGSAQISNSSSTSSLPTATATPAVVPSAAAPPPLAVDPFSGQDPFNADPFGSTGNKDRTQPSSAWGTSSPFDVDPFGQQNAQTPTDPFANSDPFGDDVFGVKSGGSSNPFQTSGASKGGWANEKEQKKEKS